MAKHIALVIFIFLSTIVIIQKKTERPIFQSIMLCRVPLICSLFLLLFPVIAITTDASSLFKNLFWLTAFWEIVSVMVISVVTGFMIVQTSELILQQAPFRMGIDPLVKVSDFHLGKPDLNEESEAGGKDLRKANQTLALGLEATRNEKEKRAKRTCYDIFLVPPNKWKTMGPTEVGIALKPLWAHLFAFSLSVPVGVGIVFTSYEYKGWYSVASVLTGLAMGSGFILMVAWLKKKIKLGLKKPEKKDEQTTYPGGKDVPENVSSSPKHKGYGINREAGDPLRNHAQVSLPAILVLLLFIVVINLMNPPDVLLPALFFVINIILMLGYAFAAATFFLDPFRVPLLFGFTWLAVLLSYSAKMSSHYYQIDSFKPVENNLSFQPSAPKTMVATQHQKPISESQMAQLRNPLQLAFDARFSKQNNRDVLIVVASSGGGIQAAAWTARVLTGLHEDPNFGPEFFQSTHHVSTVSGGTIGALFFLDRFHHLQRHSERQSCKENHPNLDEIREDILQNSMENSLPSIAWALAIEDTFRYLRILNLSKKKNETGSGRSWALEQTFKARLDPCNQVKESTLRGKWADRVKKGDLPLPVFNATLVESGERYLLAPFDLPDTQLAQSFVYMYPEYDIHIATAARLSATFPYVSTVASPSSDNGPVQPGWHVTDGGLFDNYGLFSTVEWLNSIGLPMAVEHKIKRVIILQINPFPMEMYNEPDEKEGLGSGSEGVGTLKKMDAWAAAAFGPVKALTKVRTSTQQARNITELNYLRAAWSQSGIQICEFDIRFSPGLIENTEEELKKNKNKRWGKKEGQPLSWKLSQNEKENINDAWTGWKKSNLYTQLCNVWKGLEFCEACTDGSTETVKFFVDQQRE